MIIHELNYHLLFEISLDGDTIFSRHIHKPVCQIYSICLHPVDVQDRDPNLDARVGRDRDPNPRREFPKNTARAEVNLM